VRQRLLPPGRLQKLEHRIRELAEADSGNTRLEQQITQKRNTLSQVKSERDQAAQNLARAKNDEQYRAISDVFDQLSKRVESLETEIAAADA